MSQKVVFYHNRLIQISDWRKRFNDQSERQGEIVKTKFGARIQFFIYIIDLFIFNE